MKYSYKLEEKVPAGVTNDLLNFPSLAEELLKVFEPTRVDLTGKNYFIFYLKTEKEDRWVYVSVPQFVAFVQKKFPYWGMNKSVFKVTNDDRFMFVECETEREAYLVFNDRYPEVPFNDIKVKFLWFTFNIYRP